MKIKLKLKKTTKFIAYIGISVCVLTGIYTICIGKDKPLNYENRQGQLENKDVKDAKPIEMEEPKKEEPKKEETGKIIYMTFDDGPHFSTSQLLDVLDKYHVKATFFVTAQFLDEENLIKQIKEIAKRGHEVAVHSYSHDYNKIYNSVDAYVQDYQKMDDIIFKAIGKRSKLFRFPGGSNTGYNVNIREALITKMESMGLTYYDWNAYNGDCDGYTGQQLINKTITESSYTDKSILLMHDMPNKQTVPESLPSIITQLQQNGYRFLALHEAVEPIQFS